MSFKIFMTTSSNIGARCSFSRKTLLAVAVVSAAGAVVVTAYAKGRKKRRSGEGEHAFSLPFPQFGQLVMLSQSKPSDLFDAKKTLKFFTVRRTVSFSEASCNYRYGTLSDMTSSSTSTTLSDERCINKSWSEQIEAEEVEGKHKVSCVNDIDILG